MTDSTNTLAAAQERIEALEAAIKNVLDLHTEYMHIDAVNGLRAAITLNQKEGQQ